MKHFLAKKYLGRLSSCLLVCCLLATNVLSTLILVAPNRALAAQKGTWIDSATIIIGSDIYRRTNILDNEFLFTGASQGIKSEEGNLDKKVDCSNKLKIDNPININGDWTKGGLTATLDIPDRNNPLQCVYKSNDTVDLENNTARWVNAYRIDTDTVFMPACITPTNVNAAFGTIDYVQMRDCTFKHPPKSMTFYKDDLFTFGNIDPGDENNGGKWVDLGEKKQWAKACEDVPLLSPNLCGKDSINVTLANNGDITQPDSRAGYKIGDTTDSDSDAANGEDTPSCEKNNPSIIIGWVVCAFINVLDNAVDKSTEIVNDLLDFDTNKFNNGSSSEQLKAAWGVFRVVSSFALVAVVLVMVIGQALGGGG